MSDIQIEPVPYPTFSDLRTFRENHKACARNWQRVKNQFQVFNVLDYAAPGTTDYYLAIMGALNAAKAAVGGSVILPGGLLRYGTTITLDSTYNGISIRGQGRFASTLQYTGSSDGFSVGDNLNGFDLAGFRLYSTTGRDAISFTNGAASATPDGGVMRWRDLDIRGWLRHGIKGRLTIEWTLDSVFSLLNGGCGLYIENANPYRATTLTVIGGAYIQNGGHGVVLKGTFTQSFFGVATDSNTGLSTDADTISCAGYTLIGGGVWVNCVDADIGKAVTQGGVTVGTLGHYDNTLQYMIIDCTTPPSGTGALAVTAGTGSSTTSAFRKNSHGLYAARSAYIHIDGGHFENHLFGIYLDSIYDSYINPGYILTQGTGAFGVFLAGVCQRITIPIIGVDVQTGGIAAAYNGPLCIGTDWYKPGAYTTINRSNNYFQKDTQNAGSTKLELLSTGSNPWNSETSAREIGYFSGTHDTDSEFSVNNSGGAAARAVLSLRKSGNRLLRMFVDNFLNSCGFLIGSNVLAIFDAGTTNDPDVVQTNIAGKMYLAGQGQSGPMVVEGSSPNADATASSMAEYSGSAPLNNGVKSIARIKQITMGAVANERGGRHVFTTRTAGVSGTEVDRVVLDENGFGYAVGVGGTVAQATDKTTGVTLSKVSGQITMNAAALAAGAAVSFTLTNTAIAATDILQMNNAATGTPGAYSFDARCAAGSALITVRNLTAGSLSEAIVIGFVLFKGTTS
jgi:hypothetical protein